jgi:capsular polysaccharide transport system permease protein
MPTDVAYPADTAVDTVARTSLRRSLGIQGRVIHALMMRELITRFGRHNLGVLWLVGEPMLFTIGVATLWTAAGLHQTSSLPIVAFAITGYSSVLMWRNTTSHCIAALGQNRNLLYHRNVRVIDVMLTRILLEAAGATMSFTALSAGAVAFGLIAPPGDPLKVLGGWLMLAWFGAALGITLGSAVAYGEIVDRLWHPVSYLLFPLSGAAFMVDWLPRGKRDLALMLPMVHGVEYVREGFFGGVVHTYHDLGYMATINLVLSLIGLILMRRAARHLEQR